MIRWLVLLLVTVTGASFGMPAAAHEGAGAIEVLAAEPAAADARAYRVRVSFVADGHSAPEATVAATIVNQAGAVPVPLSPTAEEGVYEGTVRFPGPGVWTVRLTSLRPFASIERTESIAAPVDEATATTEAVPTTIGSARADGDEEDDVATAPGDSTAVGAVLAVAAAVAVVAVVAVVRRRRQADA